WEQAIQSTTISSHSIMLGDDIYLITGLALSSDIIPPVMGKIIEIFQKDFAYIKKIAARVSTKSGQTKKDVQMYRWCVDWGKGWGNNFFEQD
ncbi:MAG: hypothetical protein KC588_13725, partial [Nitrospira sp.]|nr:hypothetical protein [Nitrospira sp.]